MTEPLKMWAVVRNDGKRLIGIWPDIAQAIQERTIAENNSRAGEKFMLHEFDYAPPSNPAKRIIEDE